MINGLLTLRGAWDKVRTDPVVKFLITAVTFYGMSTFEGPLLSIKSVSALAHYTDWIVAHVHGGALGWNGFLTFGMLYYLVPKLWNTKLYSVKLANVHFWVGTLGILLYILSMWAAGITQGLMWQATDAQGQLLYPDFVETVIRIVPLYYVRALGGILFMGGFLVMIYNVWRTIKQAPAQVEAEAVNPKNNRVSVLTLQGEPVHRALEGVPAIFTTLVVIAVLVASVISIVPTLMTPVYFAAPKAIRPYSPLELTGRDIYVREGCYVCHSQEIRTLTFDVLRYGPPTTQEESAYDHPFQWGSKRIGPDLARVGKKYPNLWHYRHMMDPREVVPKSIMPTYGWLAKDQLKLDTIQRKLRVMQQLGVPYTEYEIQNAEASAVQQAKNIAADLAANGAPTGLEEKEIVALIAYLQSLGQMSKQPVKQ
jgi:cytochrome c oxidase cbb3-type subunit I/II